MPESVRLGSYSMWTKQQHGYNVYDWCVFIDEDPDVTERIAWVEYTLHPTFPDPVRRVSNRAARFALMSSGWGGFGVGALIHFSNGRETRQVYSLELFQDKWPKHSPASSELSEPQRFVYDALPDGARSRWRKPSTISKSTGLTEERVRRILEELEVENFARRAFFPSIEGETLWGSTKVVGITPRSLR